MADTKQAPRSKPGSKKTKTKTPVDTTPTGAAETTVDTTPTGAAETTETTVDTTPTGAAETTVDTTPTGAAETTVDTTPTGAAKTTGADTPPEVKPEPEPELSPIAKLRVKRTDAETEIAALNAKIGVAAAAGETHQILSLSAEIGALVASIETLTETIREDGFAESVTPGLLTAFEAVPEGDRSVGDQRWYLKTTDGLLTSFVRVTVGAPKVRAITKVAALVGTSGKTRDHRLPPPGSVLVSVGGPNGTCSIAFGDDNAVRVSGIAHNGDTMDGEVFGTLSGAALRHKGKATNGFTWAKLGLNAHGPWNGAQRNSKGVNYTE